MISSATDSKTTASLGLVALGAGIVVGFLPARTSEAGYPGCGSVLSGGIARAGSLPTGLDARYYEMLCADKIAPMRAWLLALTMLGIILILMGVVGLVLSARAHAQQVRLLAEQVAARLAAVPAPTLGDRLTALATLHAAGALSAADYELEMGRAMGR